MTGFARVRKTAPDGEIVVSIKSVNHRGLDMHFHMAAELDPFEGAIRNAVKAKVARGHLQIHVPFNRTAPADGSSLNRPLLQAYLQAFREACADFGAGGPARSERGLAGSRHAASGRIRRDRTPAWSRRCWKPPAKRSIC